MEIWNELKLKRKALKLSMNTVSKDTGILKSTLSKIENGISKNPYYNTVKKLLDYYNEKSTKIVAK